MAVRRSQQSPMLGQWGLLADGVEVALAHEGAQVVEALAGGHAHLEPLRQAADDGGCSGLGHGAMIPEARTRLPELGGVVYTARPAGRPGEEGRYACGC